jgi:hypothetical protein
MMKNVALQNETLSSTFKVNDDNYSPGKNRLVYFRNKSLLLKLIMNVQY